MIDKSDIENIQSTNMSVIKLKQISSEFNCKELNDDFSNQKKLIYDNYLNKSKQILLHADHLKTSQFNDKHDKDKF